MAFLTLSKEVNGAAPILVIDRHNSDSSIALDLLRSVAAQAVCIGHALAFHGLSDGWTAHHPYPQNLAVSVFFLLSGLLIGNTLGRRSKGGYTFRDYAIERVARIYSGWIPALLFVAIVDGALLLAGIYNTGTYFDISTFVGNLFMLQMYDGFLGDWFGISSAGNFGSGSPFWTLAIEFHIYMFVGAVFFLVRQFRRQRRVPWPLAVTAIVFSGLPLHYLVGDVQPNLGTGLFSLWLVGFAMAFVPVRPPHPFLSAVLFGAPVLWLILAPNPGGSEYSVPVYAALALAFFAYVMLAARSKHIEGTRSASLIRFTADYSFTLYLVHYTVLNALDRLAIVSGVEQAVTGIALANIVAIALAIPTEMRHRDLAAWIRRHWPSGAMVRAE